MNKPKQLPTFNILIDTCVWLDVAKDYQQQAILAALEELVRQGDVALILPRIVVDEFARNKARVIEDSSRSLSSTLKRAKEAVEKFGDPREKSTVLNQLNDVDYRLPTLGSAAVDTVGRIEKLFADTAVVEICDSVKLRAAQRAIDKRAPFHRQRNGIDDAVLIEVYADAVAAKAAPGSRFAFVTHNIKDFSHPNANNKLPHPDIAACFSRVRSLYFITLGEALRRVRPEQFADLMIEQEWIEEPRRLPEIFNSIDELTTKVWYNRHKNLAWSIQRGHHKLVTRAEWDAKWRRFRGYGQTHTIDTVWKGALKAAKRAERKLGKDNCGPWDDFEWGMINGKLSALRWVLGDEWDMLDT
jgi:PIN domain